MMDEVRSAALVVAGVIHLLPIPGMFGAAALQRLYGLPFTEPNLRILMQHRAVLFGLLGVFLIAAATIRPDWQPIAIGGGLVSALSFLLFARMAGDYNAALRKVVIADRVAVVALLVAAGTQWL